MLAITFFIDKTKKGNYIKFHSLFFEGTSAKSDDVVYTEGLTVNGKEIASPLVAAFIRTPFAWLGGAGTICFCIWLCLFTVDFCMWYKKKKSINQK